MVAALSCGTSASSAAAEPLHVRGRTRTHLPRWCDLQMAQPHDASRSLGLGDQQRVLHIRLIFMAPYLLDLFGRDTYHCWVAAAAFWLAG